LAFVSPVLVAGGERGSLCARIADRCVLHPDDLSRSVQHTSRCDFIIYANRRSRQEEAILITMHTNLSRPLPSPKCGCSLAATLPASPATLPVVGVQVLRRKRMAFGAGVWHRVDVMPQGVAREADHLGFGCFKARPRYQLYISSCISETYAHLFELLACRFLGAPEAHRVISCFR
jgi:hypothetical protein